MKNPWEWNENDLLEMVKAATQESIELDFKESKALQNVRGQKDVRYEISKDVSAFANSAGGTLIYGMAEDGHVATGLDEGSDPNVVTKEWLDQIINATIHRKIEGLRINQIALATRNPGNVAYVVYIPQSTRTPHQALDKKFYKRYEFQSVSMEEYEIRDLYHRGEVPDLRIEFMLPRTELTINQENMMSQEFGLHTSIFNDALEPANYAVISIHIDSRLKIANARDFTVKKGLQVNLGDKSHPITLLLMNWNIPAKMPIFNQQYPFGITSNNEPLLLMTPTDGRFGNHTSYLLGYEIASPRMPIKRAYRLLLVKYGYATLSENYLSAEELAATYDKLGF
jgi:hypothetical protein